MNAVSLFIVIGLLFAIAWVYITIRDRRKRNNVPTWQPMGLFAVAACISEMTQNDNTVDLHTRLTVYAVRAESQSMAEQIVSENLGDVGTRTKAVVSIHIPEEWVKEAKAYARHTASPSLPPS